MSSPKNGDKNKSLVTKNWTTQQGAEQLGGLKHHRYIKPAPLPTENDPINFWLVPVATDGTFDFAQKHVMESESEIKKALYWDYKESDADSTKKYVFGDIYRRVVKKGKKESEVGNYYLGKFGKAGDSGKGSFSRFKRNDDEAGTKKSKHSTSSPLTDCIRSFRQCFAKQQKIIEDFLLQNPATYIHFSFGGAHWHELEDMKCIHERILSNFLRKVEEGVVLDAYLYKTLGTGSGQTPGFGAAGSKAYRNRVFKDEAELLDLIYAIDYSTRAVMTVSDLKIIVLPRGDGLKAEQIERFFEPRKAENQESAESKLALSLVATVADVDQFLAPPSEDEARNIAQFDFIFSKKGSSASSPDADLIELAGLDRSRLSHTLGRIDQIRNQLQAQRKRELPPMKKELAPLSISYSFRNILGDTTRAKKKYQSHLFQTLPQIYTQSYFHDPVLLPALIEKTEFNIRNDEPNFGLLRFDFCFLTLIQNEGEQNLMNIQNSPSYHIGKLLGTLARPLRSKINSFDKN